MVNILTFSHARKKFRITMYTDIKRTINVHLEEGKVMNFKELGSGLYLFSNNKKYNSKKISVYSYLNLETNFTRRKVERTDYTRTFRRNLGYLRYKCYLKLLEASYFQKCPTTVDDAKRVLHIYGINVKSCKEKTAIKPPTSINNIIVTPIPPTILDLHPKINLSADYFFV